MTREIVSVMVDRIVEQFRPTRIVLFSSQAHGDASESGDADLLVVMKNIPDKHKAAVDIRRSLRDMPTSKGIVVATPDEVARRGRIPGTIIRAALREEVVVYGQDG